MFFFLLFCKIHVFHFDPFFQALLQLEIIELEKIKTKKIEVEQPNSFQNFRRFPEPFWPRTTLSVTKFKFVLKKMSSK